MEVWHSSIFEQFETAFFIPVFRILSKFVYVPLEYRSKMLMIIIPRLNFAHV